MFSQRQKKKTEEKSLKLVLQVLPHFKYRAEFRKKEKENSELTSDRVSFFSFA